MRHFFVLNLTAGIFAGSKPYPVLDSVAGIAER